MRNNNEEVMVYANTIEPGEFFRRPRGRLTYLCIRAVGGLDPSCVHGVNFKGNTTTLGPRHVVIPMTAAGFFGDMLTPPAPVPKPGVNTKTLRTRLNRLAQTLDEVFDVLEDE